MLLGEWTAKYQRCPKKGKQSHTLTLATLAVHDQLQGNQHDTLVIMVHVRSVFLELTFLCSNCHLLSIVQECPYFRSKQTC